MLEKVTLMQAHKRTFHAEASSAAKALGTMAATFGHLMSLSAEGRNEGLAQLKVDQLNEMAVDLNEALGDTIFDEQPASVDESELTLQHQMDRITGQKAIVTKARKSVASFKIRDGMPIGAKVTLRRHRMYEFLDRLVNVAIPRVRDFRGLSAKSFDGRGNYSMGVQEQIIFPEIDYDKIDTIRGLDIAITTTARNDDEARALLKAFRLPLRG